MRGSEAWMGAPCPVSRSRSDGSGGGLPPTRAMTSPAIPHTMYPLGLPHLPLQGLLVSLGMKRRDLGNFVLLERRPLEGVYLQRAISK